jgi:hypothetical protein
VERGRPNLHASCTWSLLSLTKTKTMGVLFRFNDEKLVFEKTNKLLKYRLIVTLLIVCVALLTMSVVKYRNDVAIKEMKIAEKERRISEITTPLREESYIEDLVNAIGHNFTKTEILQIEDIAFKYKDKVEEAQVPMTLVIWIAYKESRFDHTEKNPNSSACGLFGFIDSTWNSMCKLKGTSTIGRFNRDKQVDVLLTYLNYLYGKHKDWKTVMKMYHGGSLQYPFKFLIK